MPDEAARRLLTADRRRPPGGQARALVAVATAGPTAGPGASAPAPPLAFVAVALAPLDARRTLAPTTPALEGTPRAPPGTTASFPDEKRTLGINTHNCSPLEREYEVGAQTGKERRTPELLLTRVRGSGVVLCVYSCIYL